LFFTVETGVPSADDAQMPRPKVVDRTTVDILLDDRRADV